LRALALVALLAGVLFALPGMAQLPEPNQNPNAQKAEAPQTEKTVPNEPVAPVAPATKPEPQSGTKHKEECSYGGPKWFASFYCFFAVHEKFWVSFGTLLLAFVTGTLFVATVFLYRATRSLVQGAESASEQQLRAYVTIDCTDVTDQKGDRDRFRFHFVIKNVGFTPAYDLRSNSRVTALSHPLGPDFSFPLEEGANPSVVTLGPRQEIKLDSTDERSRTKQEMADLTKLEAKIRMYCYGTIKYRTFGKERYVNFCYFMSWIPAVDKPGLFRLDIHASEHHNDGN